MGIPAKKEDHKASVPSLLSNVGLSCKVPIHSGVLANRINSQVVAEGLNRSGALPRKPECCQDKITKMSKEIDSIKLKGMNLLPPLKMELIVTRVIARNFVEV